jgi:hypothetical protein
MVFEKGKQLLVGPEVSILQLLFGCAFYVFVHLPGGGDARLAATIM